MVKHPFTVPAAVTLIGLVPAIIGGNTEAWAGVMPLQAITGVNTVSAPTIPHTIRFPEVCGRPTQVASKAIMPDGIWEMMVGGGTGMPLYQVTTLPQPERRIRLPMPAEVNTTSP